MTFSKKEKYKIYQLQEGKCARCGEKLPFDKLYVTDLPSGEIITVTKLLCGCCNTSAANKVDNSNDQRRSL